MDVVKVLRYKHNPILIPSDIKPTRDDFEVVCTFNAGVARFGDETIMLVRVAERPTQDHENITFPVFDSETGETVVLRFRRDDPEVDLSDPRIIRHGAEFYLTSLSHLRIARSSDGLHFVPESRPALTAREHYEAYGVEDPRITEIDGTYYIAYVGASPHGICTCLATTTDFKEYKRLGRIFVPDNRDVCIFPQRFDGRFAAYHRPSPRYIGRPEMYFAYSPDMLHWGEHYNVLTPGLEEWDEGRVGGGAPPLRTEKGWLSIYHAATVNNVYCLGAMLTELDAPYRIIARSKHPLLRPEAAYEVRGFFRNVVFACGVTLDGDLLRIYYGGADTVMAIAQVSLAELLDHLLAGG